MGDVPAIRSAIERIAAQEPNHPLVEISFQLLEMAHAMQQEIAALRAENRALSTELRKIAAQKKTPRERVSDADINRGFRQIRQELTEQIALQNANAPVDLLENQGPLNKPAGDQAKGTQTSPTDEQSTAGNQDPNKPKRRNPGGRRKIPSTLPTKILTILPDNLPGGARFMRFEVSYRVGFEPGGLYRVEVRRGIFSVPSDQEIDPAVKNDKKTPLNSAVERGVCMASPPLEVLTKGLPTPDLLSYIIFSKFGLYLPLNRLEKETERMGFRLSRSTMCVWLLRLATWVEKVLAVWRKDGFARAPYLATDATSVSVLAPKRCKKGYFWTVIAGGHYVFYHFTKTHDHVQAQSILSGFPRTILADGTAVLNVLFEEPDDGLLDDSLMDSSLPTRAGCWAHARRYFIVALQTGGEHALAGVGFINMLFEFEREMIGLTPEKRLNERQTRSAVVIARLRQWLLERRPKAPEGSALARAFTYLFNQWEPLQTFLRDGSIPISNNDSERSLRAMVVGRLNWLFLGHEEAGIAAANYASIVATCRLHRIDPGAFLTDFFRVLPHWPEDRYLELAPDRWLATRSKLNATELARPMGPLQVPPQSD